MKHDVPFNGEGILRPTIEFLEIMPAVGGISIQEYAAGRGIEQTSGTVKAAGGVISVLIVQSINRHNLVSKGHLNAIGEALCQSVC